MFKLNEYFSYQEILNYIKEEHAKAVPAFPNDKDVESTWFTAILTEFDMKLTPTALDASFTSIDAIVDVLMFIVYNRHAEDIIFTGSKIVWGMEAPTYTLEDKDIKKVLSKLVNVIDLTIPKYIPLLKQYNSASVNPIAPIKSTSKGKTAFNDTPQNIGDWGDEDHTSNISASESETSVDVGSLMERLASMYKDYKSVILEWSNEFNQVFLKEEQVCL